MPASPIHTARTSLGTPDVGGSVAPRLWHSSPWATAVWMRPRHMLPAKKFKRKSAAGRILALCAVIMDAAHVDAERFNERSRLSQFLGGLMPLFLLLGPSSLRRIFERN